MQACACRVCPGERKLSQMSLWVFSRFVSFCEFVIFCRAGMSYRVNAYSLSGGGSIDWVPGVVSAAWGGLWRAWRAVRAAPKTRNYTSTRVLNMSSKHNTSPAHWSLLTPQPHAQTKETPALEQLQLSAGRTPLLKQLVRAAPARALPFTIPLGSQGSQGKQG